MPSLKPLTKVKVTLRNDSNVLQPGMTFPPLGSAATKNIKAGGGVGPGAPDEVVQFGNIKNGAYKDSGYFRTVQMGNDTDVSFQLPEAKRPEAWESVTICGVHQAPTSYSISGDQITFVEPPPSGCVVDVEVFWF